jgi:hypothetical protein
VKKPKTKPRLGRNLFRTINVEEAEALINTEVFNHDRTSPSEEKNQRHGPDIQAQI